MRLLHVTHQYRPAIGGSELYFSQLSEELAARHHQVDVITTRSASVQNWSAELSALENLAGVNVYRFPALGSSRLTWRVLRLGHEGLRTTGAGIFELPVLAGTGPIAPGLAWHILRHGHSYDLVHIQALPFAHVVYAYLCARIVHRPVVITPHIHVDQERTFDLATFNAVMRGSDAVIAVSEREIPYLTSRGIRRERIIVAGNGVRIECLPRLDPTDARARLGVPQDAFVLLFLGRKESYKGLPTLVRAFGQLCARYPRLHLISAGPATDESRALAREYAGFDRWTDLDAVDERRKIDLLNAADVLILPSTGEAFGIVFLEAWALRKPVIGARAGGIPWVIDDQQDGLLVEPDDPAALASAIERLVNSPELCRKLGLVGESKLRSRYTVQRVADRVEEAYELALRHSRRCARTAPRG